LPVNARSTTIQPDGRSAEAAALEGLYERYSRRVFAFCLARLRKRDEAEDAAQTTFLYALNGLRRGVVPAVELAWLFKIANNVCLSRFDNARRRRKIEFASDPQSLAELAPAREDDRTDASELTEALARLPVQQRRALLLREWRGLSYAEIANELGMSQSAVETLLFRARRRFARELRDGRDEARRDGLDLASLLGWAKSIFTAGVPKLAAASLAVGTIGAVTASTIEHQSHRHRPAQPAMQAGRDSALTGQTVGGAALAVQSTHRAALMVRATSKAALRIPATHKAALRIPAPPRAAMPASVRSGEAQFKTDASSSPSAVTTIPSSTPQRSAPTAPPSRGVARLPTPPALPNQSVPDPNRIRIVAPKLRPLARAPLTASLPPIATPKLTPSLPPIATPKLTPLLPPVSPPIATPTAIPVLPPVSPPIATPTATPLLPPVSPPIATPTATPSLPPVSPPISLPPPPQVVPKTGLP
jgi:RNA polymerase sigma factor (sigma-70 family)